MDADGNVNAWIPWSYALSTIGGSLSAPGILLFFNVVLFSYEIDNKTQPNLNIIIIYKISFPQ